MEGKKGRGEEEEANKAGRNELAKAGRNQLAKAGRKELALEVDAGPLLVLAHFKHHLHADKDGHAGGGHECGAVYASKDA